MEARTGVFGGTFDPVHNGHVQIVQSFLQSGLLDEILILLTPDPPHKSQANTGYNDRMEMLRLAFSDIENVRISDLETRLPTPSYTLQTLKYLKKNHPKTRFFLCIGGDSLATIHEWYHYKEILELVPLVVAERPGSDYSNVDTEILNRTVFVDHNPVDLSSTDVRKTKFGNRSLQLPDKVEEYIQKYRLYRSKD